MEDPHLIIRCQGGDADNHPPQGRFRIAARLGSRAELSRNCYIYLFTLPNQMVHMSRHVLTPVAVAVFSLSVLGPPVQAQDNPLAQELANLRALAEAGATEAQYIFGVMYDTGLGVPQDPAEAVRWYRLAAEQGHASAQNNLGIAYGTGEGVPQDPAEAVRWYRLAAEQGHAKAQYNLGVKYDTGEGVPQDDIEAHMWLNLAASRLSGTDRERSVGARDRVAELMTPADLSEAQRRAREWHAAHTVP